MKRLAIAKRKSLRARDGKPVFKLVIVRSHSLKLRHHKDRYSSVPAATLTRWFREGLYVAMCG